MRVFGAVMIILEELEYRWTRNCIEIVLIEFPPLPPPDFRGLPFSAFSSDRSRYDYRVSSVKYYQGFPFLFSLPFHLTVQLCQSLTLPLEMGFQGADGMVPVHITVYRRLVEQVVHLHITTFTASSTRVRTRS